MRLLMSAVVTVAATMTCCGQDAAEPAAAELGQDAVASLSAWLAGGNDPSSELAMQPFARTPLTASQAERVRDLLWQNLQTRLAADCRGELNAKALQIGELTMPFEYSVFGDAPDDGHSLVISMHGGGGAPKAVNDRQWKNQQRLYTLDEGIYVAPRAPTDTWNLWHQAHIDQFFERLILAMVVCEGVNPDRVYLTGYSAGGDGVYQLAPRMADRFAAAAMMAGHPNETLPLGLRNLPFALHVGASDSAYDRNAVAARWKDELATLQENDPEGYIHQAELHAGKGHWMDREEAAAIPWMQQFVRNTVPRRIVWKQDDVTHDAFYWLAVPEESATPRSLVSAAVDGQTMTIEHSDVRKLRIRLRDDLLDLDQPVVVQFRGEPLFAGHVPRTIATVAETLNSRRDPKLTWSAEIQVDVPASPQ